MSEQPPQGPYQPPPGWYRDPGGQKLLRWWDGRAWTPHTQPGPEPQAGISPVTQPRPQPQVRRSAQGSSSHWVRNTFAVIGALAVAGIIISALGSGSPAPASTADAGPASSASAASSPAAQVGTTTPGIHVVRTRKQVVFKVWGIGEPQITYGTDSDNLGGGGTSGQLGDANTLPWSASLPYSTSPLYWYVDAQLEGYGDIHCAVDVRVTVWESSGTSATTTRQVVSGHASDSYNICSAETN